MEDEIPLSTTVFRPIAGSTRRPRVWPGWRSSGTTRQPGHFAPQRHQGDRVPSRKGRQVAPRSPRKPRGERGHIALHQSEGKLARTPGSTTPSSRRSSPPRSGSRALAGQTHPSSQRSSPPTASTRPRLSRSAQRTPSLIRLTLSPVTGMLAATEGVAVNDQRTTRLLGRRPLLLGRGGPRLRRAAAAPRRAPHDGIPGAPGEAVPAPRAPRTDRDLETGAGASRLSRSAGTSDRSDDDAHRAAAVVARRYAGQRAGPRRPEPRCADQARPGRRARRRPPAGPRRARAEPAGQQRQPSGPPGRGLLRRQRAAPPSAAGELGMHLDQPRVVGDGVDLADLVDDVPGLHRQAETVRLSTVRARPRRRTTSPRARRGAGRGRRAGAPARAASLASRSHSRRPVRRQADRHVDADHVDVESERLRDRREAGARHLDPVASSCRPRPPPSRRGRRPPRGCASPPRPARLRAMRVHIGSDHAGFELKAHLVERLGERGYEVVDHGPVEYDPVDDYPPYVLRAAVATVNDAGQPGRGHRRLGQRRGDRGEQGARRTGGAGLERRHGQLSAGRTTTPTSSPSGPACTASTRPTGWSSGS